jgi:ribosomal protein L11 methyltransferase
VGTGTGILCIRAAQLGAEHALGIDTDADAVEVARENFVINGVQQKAEVKHGDVRDLEGPFDLIMSNIQSSTLVPLLSTFARLLDRAGVLVFSGVLAEEEEVFCRGVTKKGFAVGTIWREGEWIGLAATTEVR